MNNESLNSRYPIILYYKKNLRNFNFDEIFAACASESEIFY